ncbi:MAG: sigma-70 family RNA polymerase sigma factor [Ectothiorhodospiraceae bacterium]|nr:sigma-70 family RNA polymerase sigma factor [Ectothiorhodospiraceae bacterium]
MLDTSLDDLLSADLSESDAPTPAASPRGDAKARRVRVAAALAKDDTPELDDAESDEPLAVATETPEDLSVIDSYYSVAREVPLLTKEQEVELGREIRDSRSELAAAVARIPLAARWFLAALDEAETGDRLLADVVLAPFGSTEVEPVDDAQRRGASWRKAAADMRAHLDDWHKTTSRGSAKGRRARAIAKEIESAFLRAEPGSPLLAEMLEQARAVERAARVAEDADAVTIAGTGCTAAQLRDACKDASRALHRYRRARQHMVEANFRLAFHMARKLAGNGVALEDLIQEALLGLMRAAEKFDYRLGYKFSTYASQWIWQGITRAIADGSRTIRVAAHMHDTIVRLKKISRGLQQTLGRDPTLQELSAAADLPIDKVRKALESGRQPLSLDAPIADVDDSSLHNCIEDSAVADPIVDADAAQVSSEVADLLAGLPTREAMILRLRHGIGVPEPLTLEEIGRVLGITRERTRQLEARAINRLRHEADPGLVASLMD